MKLIKFLQKVVVLMFVVLFSLMFLYLKDSETKNNNVKIAEIEPYDEEEENVIIAEVSEEETYKSEILEQKTETTNKISNNKFYYSNLDEYSKLIYDSLEQNKNNLKNGTQNVTIPSSISAKLEDEKEISEIFSAAVNAFEYDNPDVFFLDVSKILLYSEKNGLGKYKIYIRKTDESSNYLLPSFKNETEVNNAQKRLDKIVNDILKNANSKEDDYSKVLYVHDWLTSNVKYNVELNKENKDNIYGAIVEKEAVCGGYSKAFKYLLDKLNINCIIVQGTAISSEGQENHAWNLVELNGKWYGVDCTWDDPVIVGDLTNYTEKQYYTFFLKGQDELNSNHIPSTTFYETDIKLNYPKLSTENY